MTKVTKHMMSNLPSKFVLSLFLLVGSSSSAFAQDEAAKPYSLTVGDNLKSFTIAPAKEKWIDINLNNPTQKMSAIQLDVLLPLGVEIDASNSSLSLQRSKRTTKVTHSLSVRDMNEIVQGTGDDAASTYKKYRITVLPSDLRYFKNVDETSDGATLLRVKINADEDYLSVGNMILTHIVGSSFTDQADADGNTKFVFEPETISVVPEVAVATVDQKDLSVALGKKSAPLMFALKNILPIGGLQADIQLPAGLHFAKQVTEEGDELIALPTDDAEGFSVAVDKIQNTDNNYRVVFSSVSAKELEYSDKAVNLFSLQVEADDENFQGGDIVVNNFIVAANQGRKGYVYDLDSAYTIPVAMLPAPVATLGAEDVSISAGIDQSEPVDINLANAEDIKDFEAEVALTEGLSLVLPEEAVLTDLENGNKKLSVKKEDMADGRVLSFRVKGSKGMTEPASVTFSNLKAGNYTLDNVLTLAVTNDTIATLALDKDSVNLAGQAASGLVTLSMNNIREVSKVVADVTLAEGQTLNLPEGVTYENGKLTVEGDFEAQAGKLFDFTVGGQAGKVTFSNFVVTAKRGETAYDYALEDAFEINVHNDIVAKLTANKTQVDIAGQAVSDIVKLSLDNSIEATKLVADVALTEGTTIQVAEGVTYANGQIVIEKPLAENAGEVAAFTLGGEAGKVTLSNVKLTALRDGEAYDYQLADQIEIAVVNNTVATLSANKTQVDMAGQTTSDTVKISLANNIEATKLVADVTLTEGTEIQVAEGATYANGQIVIEKALAQNAGEVAAFTLSGKAGKVTLSNVKLTALRDGEAYDYQLADQIEIAVVNNTVASLSADKSHVYVTAGADMSEDITVSLDSKVAATAVQAEVEADKALSLQFSEGATVDTLANGNLLVTVPVAEDAKLFSFAISASDEMDETATVQFKNFVLKGTRDGAAFDYALTDVFAVNVENQIPAEVSTDKTDITFYAIDENSPAISVLMDNTLKISAVEAEFELPEHMYITYDDEQSPVFNLTKRTNKTTVTTDTLENGNLHLTLQASEGQYISDSKGALFSFRVNGTDQLVKNSEIKIRHFVVKGTRGERSFDYHLDDVLVIAVNNRTAVGINGVTETGAQLVGIYTLAGQKVSEPVSGQINIFKYADGTSRKVLVK